MIDDCGRSARVIVSLLSLLVEAGLAMPPFPSVGIDPGCRQCLALFYSTILPDGRCRLAGKAISRRRRGRCYRGSGRIKVGIIQIVDSAIKSADRITNRRHDSVRPQVDKRFALVMAVL
ncbi:hypothetical protein B0J13DRAFT_558207 [Dactylonectria estremocensis]|uniref:Uncharacterized protein n=1 Tax=Dactylonectria estremocensis TaxID=1079267 RepID=A0A9P9ENW2_9HYPO|nr:hypothetical protein B0J13DRAFT_558207 [Dactylonectria estremocensis]